MPERRPIAFEETVPDHLVVHSWLNGWHVLKDAHGHLRQERLKKGGENERRARQILAAHLRNSGPGVFFKLAELIDPPYQDLPRMDINRGKRGQIKDEFRHSQIKRFVEKRIANGRTKNEAKAEAMMEFAIEKTTIEKVLYPRRRPHR
jgi:hypothetical protein